MRVLGQIIALAFLASLLVFGFQNCTGKFRSSQITQAGFSSSPLVNPQHLQSPVFTAQVQPSVYDPKPRYLYTLADLDGNGVRDSLVTDRQSGLIAVRLIGKFQSGHPYLGVDQAACTKDVWNSQHASVQPQPNVDFCNAAMRPEEDWGHVAIADSESVQIIPGRFQAPGRESLMIWAGSRIVSADAQIVPDVLHKRALAQTFQFKMVQYDLSHLNVCNVGNLFSDELAKCQTNRWQNLARPWESVTVADLNGDGLEDLVGMVNVDDGDPQSQLGVWALVADGQGGFSPELLAVVDYTYRGARMYAGRFNGGMQVVFVRPDQFVISAITLDSALRLSASQIISDLTVLAPGGGQVFVDDLSTGRFLGSDLDLHFRLRRETADLAHDFILHGGQVAQWYCPWSPSALDPASANQACLQSDVMTSATLLAQTGSVVVQSCADCRADIQTQLSRPEIRNVILAPGTYDITGSIYVSSLDTQGNMVEQTKRLIGSGTVNIKGHSPFYSVDSSGNVQPILPASATAAQTEAAASEKCRVNRDYDGDWYDALWKRRLVSDCGVIETRGSHISVLNLTIDTADLAAVANYEVLKQREAGSIIMTAPNYNSILLGYFVHGRAFAYMGDGTPSGYLPLHTFDTSRAQDEDIRIAKVYLNNVPTGGIATYSTPMPVRNVLVEDIYCYPSRQLAIQGNCIELDAPVHVNWTFDDSYRKFIAFGPPPIQNFTVKRGPHKASFCEMHSNGQTVRVSGAVGFVADNCDVEKGQAGEAFFLYVTDTGAKLDATLRNVRVSYNLSHVAAQSLLYDDSTQYPYYPARTDQNGRTIYQDNSILNDPLITVSGRGMSRNTYFNSPTDSILNADEIYNGLRYIYRETPSQVFIDGLTSTMTNLTGADAQKRVHIKENLALSGKFICRNCTFAGGGQIMSADFWDLWSNYVTCDIAQSRTSCISTGAIRQLIPGNYVLLGYDANQSPLTMLDPNQQFGREHGKWFEFINGSASGIYQDNAISIIPGSIDLNQPYHLNKGASGAFSVIVK